MANAWACQGSANTGPSSSRGIRGKTFKRSVLRSGSGVFKIVIPHVEVNGIFRRCIFSPKLTRRELHGIHMLALFAEEPRIRVREQKDAVVEHDLAGLTSRVAG